MQVKNSAFQQLKNFLLHEMRMAHVYQPVMIRELLSHKGRASTERIARALLAEDRSQVDYYRQIVRNMVGKVLTKNRGLTRVDGDTYSLEGFDSLKSDEIAELKAICDEKIRQYLERREDPWSHRRKTTGYVPGTLRYEVLKRAHFRCELCGVSAEHKALEVDHIVPRNKDGTDDPSNLQALCYSCNSTKRDRDDTDFRNMAARYKERQSDCVFCNLSNSRVIAENELCVAIRDQYPVTHLHTLIIPKRHVDDYFGLLHPERTAVSTMIDRLRADIVAEDPSVSGFNVGMNAGKSAGQTIFHCHIHLIPRREGDVENPAGGVRGVIPMKQQYR